MEFEGGGMTDDTLMTTDPGRETADVYHLRRWLREREDEINRLRELLDHGVEALRAAGEENERLRVAYEQERQDCINLTEKVIPNLRAEIERLRGLLREGIGDIWIRNADGSFTCLYEAIAAWHKRVREALGDAP